MRISPWAYLMEVRDDDDGWGDCISLINEGPDNALFLGAGLLRGVRMVVDVQNENTGCKYLNLSYKAVLTVY